MVFMMECTVYVVQCNLVLVLLLYAVKVKMKTHLEEAEKGRGMDMISDHMR